MPTPQPNILPPRKEDAPTEPTTMVVVCRDTDASDADPDACIHRWRAQGWRVRRREPRVLEGPDGPSHGVLLVLEREMAPEPRLRRQPVRPNMPRRKPRVRANENV